MSGADGPAVRLAGSCRIGGRTLFQELELVVPAGRWTCLLGPSGVGKSSLLRVLAGLPTAGAFDGVLEGPALGRRVAWMAQDDLLLPWLSVFDNVAIGARLRGEQVDRTRVLSLLRRTGLGDRGDDLPATLSGGMRQRVALARVLMEDASLVLLDEPFSALDARTRAAMQDLAWELLEGRSVVLVTHDPLEAARLGHAIWLLDENGLSAQSTPATRPPRPTADGDTLAAQGALLAALGAA
jgi:putative hydroxymethylpyrimidine transport system ATP-binding protein